jgi:trimethylamine--corrinoid protein Co-methyltransferase
MRLRRVLSRSQVEAIHRNALRVLAEVGVKVEHPELRKRLVALCGRCEPGADVVCFPADAVERLIWDAPKRPKRDEPATVGAHAGVYQSQYLDAATGELRPFDEALLARYLAFAHSRATVKSVGMLGVPFIPEGIPAPYIPLAEKLFAWKYGARPDGTVQFTGLCEPLLEVFACHAAASGAKLEQVFAATGYLISPLRLARHECEQLLFFAARGLHMGIGHLPIQGVTAPVTLGGSIVLSLAEQVFLFLLMETLWGDATFAVGGTVATADMRTGFSCYGRPEMQRINVAFADIARFYGCSCWGHTGPTDARAPSCEAGAQKAIAALITALATGHGSISAGLLAVDEICSPVQMVLDDELTANLQALLAGMELHEADYAFDEILAVGPGGSFLGTDFTAERYRRELHQPQVWTAGRLASGSRIDIDHAREIAVEFERSFVPMPRISPEEEKDLRRIIGRAVAAGLAEK